MNQPDTDARRHEVPSRAARAVADACADVDGGRGSPDARGPTEVGAGGPAVRAPASVPERHALRSGLLVIACTAVGTAGFVFDLWSPRGVADGVWYVTLVLLGLWLPWARAPLVLGAIATLLTLLGYLLSPPRVVEWIVVANRALALSAVWITAVLCYLQKRAGTRLAQEESRLRALQEELFRVARRSELGSMVGAFAHELNQPLAALRTYVAIARRALPPEAAAGEPGTALDKALAQADRAAQGMRQLLALSGTGSARRTEENLSALVEEAARLALAGSESTGIEVHYQLAPDLPACVVNRTQIQQVVLNLVRNSVDAMAASPRRELRIATARLAPDRLEFSIADSGSGLAPQVRAQLFTPFVTTKPHGIGIGLSVAHSIIEAHRGTLEAAPVDGGGTVFRARLPCAAAA